MKPSKRLPVHPATKQVTQKKISLLLSTFLLCVQLVWAQDVKTHNPGPEERVSSRGSQNYWINFPHSFRLTTCYLGITSRVPQLLGPNEKTRYSVRLWTRGVCIDAGILLIDRFIYEHFHCYPKLGAELNYGRLQNKGSLTGGLIYLEPQHDYLARWMSLPRLGIGFVYANIPGTNFKKEEAEKTDRTFEQYDRQGLHLELAIAWITILKITPHWHLDHSMGFRYLPSLDTKREGEPIPSREKALKLVTTSIALSYTPNPNLACYYPEAKIKEQIRVDVGFLSSLRGRPRAGTSRGNEYCYIGGLFGQWSLLLCGNHALTLATEWIRDRAASTTTIVSKLEQPDSLSKVSLLGGHEFRWGRLLFGQQVGYYLVNEYTLHPGNRLYVELGTTYRLIRTISVGVGMKTGGLFVGGRLNNVGVDLIDFRITYSF